MPTYEYRCSSCGYEMEAIQRISSFQCCAHAIRQRRRKEVVQLDAAPSRVEAVAHLLLRFRLEVDIVDNSTQVDEIVVSRQRRERRECISALSLKKLCERRVRVISWRWCCGVEPS